MYRSISCEGCPLKDRCTKAHGDREIKVRMEYLQLKQQVREQLKSEDGLALSVRRMHEPESAFGQIKNNRGFRRFLLRGLPKVNLEVGWLSLVHNLLKKAASDKNRKIALQDSNAIFRNHFFYMLMRAVSSASEPLLRQPHAVSFYF